MKYFVVILSFVHYYLGRQEHQVLSATISVQFIIQEK